MRRFWLTGLLLLPVVWQLATSFSRPLPRHPVFDVKLEPRPRWTPPSGPVSQPAARAAGGEQSGSAPAARASPRGTAADELVDPLPRAASTAVPTGSIPSVDSAGLLEALTRSGLACSSVSLDRGGLTWTCSAEGAHASYLVVIHGVRTDSITRMRASVTRADTDFIAQRFLASLAALEYAGAEPARARDWVTRHVAADASLTIGPVRFELSGTTGARTLDLVAEEPRP